MTIKAVHQKFGVACFLVALATACGPAWPPASEVPPSNQRDQENPSPEEPGESNEDESGWETRPPDEIQEAEMKDQICFPGNGAGPVCLNLIAPSDAEFRAHYRYQDPRTAPTFPHGFDPKQYMPPKKFLYLPDLAAALPLAKNFGLSEFMSVAKGSYGLFSPYVVAALQKIRDVTRRALFLTSAYRSPSYNQSVGGTDWSRHTFGDGVDIWVDRGSKGVITSACQRFGAGFTLLYETHVHCDWRAVGSARTSEKFHSRSEVKLPSTGGVGHAHPPAQDLDQLMRSHLGIRVNVFGSDGENKGDVLGALAVGERPIVLIADYFDIEGEGVPELEWTVTPPKGEKVHLEGQNAVFVPRWPGVHQLNLRMGGRYELQRAVNFASHD